MKKSIAILLVLLLAIPFFSVITSAGDLVNVAKGKKYTVDIGSDGTAGYSCPDPDDGTGFGDGKNLARQRLTDGVIAKDDGGGAGLIGAQQTPKAIYTLDLGSVVKGIKKLSMDMYYGPWGIGEALSIEYALSEDGTTYTTVGKVERKNAVNKVNGEWKGDDYILNLTEAKSARYVKITAVATNYVWSSEMQVFADGSGDPGSSQSASESSKDNNPETGDNGITIFAIIAIISVGAAYSYTRRKQTISDK
jgi:LPXTG-motif cell wall-anchored protein